MATIDLVCRDCRQSFQVVTRSVMKRKQKRCPECGTDNIRQTLASYFRNGPLSSASCGSAGCTTYG